MELQPILFYLFSAILIIAALLVITIRNPIHSTLFLVLAFFTSAMLWILLEAEFLALSLVLVYVGAVMVLFLFVIMMLDINLTVLREGFARYLPVGALIAVVIVLEMSLVLGPENFGLEKMPVPEKHSLDYSNTKALGSVLYTDYVFAFEVASVILLVAIVAAIALTLRSRPDSKYQEPGLQVRVRRADRIRMVDLKEKQ